MLLMHKWSSLYTPEKQKSGWKEKHVLQWGQNTLGKPRPHL